MKLLVVGNESGCPDFINYANDRGLELTVVSEKEWSAALTLDPTGYDDVLSFSDTGQILVERIKTEWKMVGRGENLIGMLTNKKRLREEGNINHLFSKYVICSATDSVEFCEKLCKEKQLGFPMIVKPANGFYSAGVSRVDDATGLPRAISLARRINNQINSTKGDVIIEAYLSGEEIAIDGIIDEGNIYPLIYHAKYPRLAGPFFHEEAYISQTVRQDFPEKQPLTQFIQALGLQSGPFHLEMRKCGQGQWHLLECAPRFSGMGLSTNIPFFKLTGKYAYDFLLSPHLIRTENWRHDHGYVMEFDFAVRTNACVTGLEAVVAKIRELSNCVFFQYAAQGEYVLAPPHNLNALLTVFCHVKTKQEAMDRYQTLKVLETELVRH